MGEGSIAHLSARIDNRSLDPFSTTQTSVDKLVMVQATTRTWMLRAVVGRHLYSISRAHNPSRAAGTEAMQRPEDPGLISHTHHMQTRLIKNEKEVIVQFVYSTRRAGRHAADRSSQSTLRELVFFAVGRASVPAECPGGGHEMTDSLREAGRLKLVQPFGLCRSFPLERLLLVELAIALVTSGVDLSPVDGILDGTAALMGM
jgi:hypothetical protein